MNARVVGLGAVVGGAALIGGQAAYASLRRLPLGEDLDPSGRIGDPGMPELHIALLGDSAVTGQGLHSVDESWPRLVANRLTERFQVVLHSYAVGGSRSVDVLQVQVPQAEQLGYDVAIVSVGANDVLHMTPVWRFERRLDEIVSRLGRVSGSVILFGVGDLGSIPRLPYPTDRLAAGQGRVADWVHKRVAERHGIAKVDQWKLTTEAFNRGPHMFAPDLFHPSAEGHVAWADAVMATIDEQLPHLVRDSESATPAAG